MWWIVVGMLLSLWLIGLSTWTTFGGFIHLLLVAAILIAVVRVQAIRERHKHPV